MCRYLCFIVLIEGVISLRMMTIDVPSTIIAGRGTRLSCSYELEDDVLYSIKWYRDDIEFFRFVPTDKPSGQYFPVQGITVDMELSNNGTVYLRDVDSSTEGTYRCEVSGDAPSFQTVFAEKHLSVEGECIDAYHKEHSELLSRASVGCGYWTTVLYGLITLLLCPVLHSIESW